MRPLGAWSGVLAVVLLVAGCGGQDRAALAHTTVQNYWSAINHRKLHRAYLTLTPGNRSSLKETEYDQNIVALLTRTHGVTATVGTARVDGDTATLRVTLHSPATNVPEPGCQHLFWTNDKWLISDDSGGLSPASECKK